MTREEEKIFGDLKVVVNNPITWNALVAWMDYAIEKEGQKLETLTDPIYIYKTQGTVDALRKIKRLRDTVRNMEERDEQPNRGAA